MKPFDPRLLRYARAARKYIGLVALLGTLNAILVVAQVYCIAAAISPVITHGASLVQVRAYILGFLIAVLTRAALTWLRQSMGERAAHDTIIELRSKVLHHASQLGPRWLARHGTDTVTLITRGLDDLGPYFVAYLPQLVLTATVTPLTILVMLYFDWTSALYAIFAIPLIPIFMILVGKLTQQFSDEKLATMERLATQLLDVIAGLPTLQALGRQRAPREHIHTLGQKHARTTMQTLRVAFLSGAILEFLATLSVALVAVWVGLRMVSGTVDLFTGLAVIMLAPEVFLPLREVGKQFHASADGLSAAQSAFEILETPVIKPGTIPAPDVRGATIELRDLSVAARGAWAPAALNTRIEPGSITALVGASGAGKTTTIMTLLQLLPPTRGNILLRAGDSVLDLRDVDPQSWWNCVTWVPQNPAILPGTIRDNVTSGSAVSDEALAAAARATRFDQVLSQCPQGWDTKVGHAGVGLSVGQRQRLALTRALLSDAPIVILDEPTAHLDAMTQTQVIDTIKQLQSQGRRVIVIAHRKAVTDAADHVIEVVSRAATAAEEQRYPELVQSEAHTLTVTSTPDLLEGAQS